MLRDSNDKYVSGADIKLHSGRKWQVEEAVKSAEEKLRQSDIIETVTHGRLGLVCITRSRFSSASKQRQRELVQYEVRQGTEESRMTKAVAQKKQGSWLRWESVRAKSYHGTSSKNEIENKSLCHKLCVRDIAHSNKSLYVEIE